MKFKTKKILKYVCLVIVAAVSLGAIVHFTGLVNNNSDVKNLIDNKADDYIISQEPGYGVSINVNGDTGAITFKGKSSMASELKVTTLELAAGTYKISGLSECTKNGFNMHVKCGTEIIAYSGIEKSDANLVSDTFTLLNDSTVSVWICWPNEHEFTSITSPFGTRILPVISAVEATK